MSEVLEFPEEDGVEILSPSVEQANSAYFEAVKAFENKEVDVSFTFLKELYKSPRHAMRYHLNKRKPKSKNPSMLKGMLVDSMLTDHFTGTTIVEDKFTVVDKAPTSANQVGFCKDILDGLTKEEAFYNNYASGSLTKTWETLEKWIEATAAGKDPVPQSVFDRAKLIFENLLENEEVVALLSKCNKYQNRINWEYNGWKNKGFSDCEGEDITVDLKFTEKLDPDKFERDILYTLMFLQAAMYTHKQEGFKKFYLLVYDNDFNFDIMEVQLCYLTYGWRLYKHLMNKLDECVKNNLWSKSYSFHNFKTVRQVYAPKWLKGFNTEIVED